MPDTENSDMEPESPNNKNPDGKKTPSGAFITGIVLAAVFGAIWIQTGIWPFVFPMVFAGILPAIRAYKKMQYKRKNITQTAQQHQISKEKQILQIAQKEKGKVSPTIIALNTELSIEEAVTYLEDMAKKGFVNINVTIEGRVQYEFPDFLENKNEEMLE